MTKIETIAWLGAVLAIGGAAARSLAEDKAKPMEALHECPMMAMHDGAPIADVVVANTDKGAVISLTAKRPEDIKAVREAAQHIADHAKGGCTMKGCGMGGHGMMGGHGKDSSGHAGHH